MPSTSCTRGFPINLPSIISRYVSGNFYIPFIIISAPFISSESISKKASTLSLKLRLKQRMPFISIRFEIRSYIFFTPDFCLQLLQVAVAPHITILEWSAISFSIELSISSPTFSQYMSIFQPFSIPFRSASNFLESISSFLQYFLQSIASLQPIDLAALHFYSLPAIPQMFLYPNLERYSTTVNPTPPATEEMTIFISQAVLNLAFQ